MKNKINIQTDNVTYFHILPTCSFSNENILQNVPTGVWAQSAGAVEYANCISAEG